MPKFIKLNSWLYGKNKFHNCYISVDRIIGFEPNYELVDDDHRCKSLLNIEGLDGDALVKETPEEILKLIAECED